MQFKVQLLGAVTHPAGKGAAGTRRLTFQETNGCSPKRLGAGLVPSAGQPRAFRCSSRNHLKEVPEAVPEGPHVACSHRESAGHRVGGRRPGLPREPVVTQQVLASPQDKSVSPPGCPERTCVPGGSRRSRAGAEMEAMGFLACGVRVSEARSSQVHSGSIPASPLSTAASLFRTHLFSVLANFPVARHFKSSVAATVSQRPRRRGSPPRCLRRPRCGPPSATTPLPFCGGAAPYSPVTGRVLPSLQKGQREPALKQHVLKQCGMKRFWVG